MSNPSTKMGFGVYATFVSAALSCVAGVYFQMIGGTFGATKRVCYDWPVVALLIGAAVVVVILTAIKKHGLAAAAVTTMSGVSLLFFVHKCYWYVSDVFVGIDEKQFDSKFITFSALAVAAFLIGEIAVYARKTKQVKA